MGDARGRARHCNRIGDTRRSRVDHRPVRKNRGTGMELMKTGGAVVAGALPRALEMRRGGGVNGVEVDRARADARLQALVGRMEPDAGQEQQRPQRPNQGAESARAAQPRAIDPPHRGGMVSEPKLRLTADRAAGRRARSLRPDAVRGDSRFRQAPFDTFAPWSYRPPSVWPHGSSTARRSSVGRSCCSSQSCRTVLPVASACLASAAAAS